MSESEQQFGMHHSATPEDRASSLEHIIDDTEERGECSDWIYQRMCEGHDPDALLAQVIAMGWPEDEAAAMVEAERRKTRHLRGVVTREDVARTVDARYRRTMSRSPFLACFGIFGVAIHSARSLLGYFSIRNNASREKRENVKT
jgi:hypothetical protein